MEPSDLAAARAWAITVAADTLQELIGGTPGRWTFLNAALQELIDNGASQAELETCARHYGELQQELEAGMDALQSTLAELSASVHGDRL